MSLLDAIAALVAAAERWRDEGEVECLVHIGKQGVPSARRDTPTTRQGGAFRTNVGDQLFFAAFAALAPAASGIGPLCQDTIHSFPPPTPAHVMLVHAPGGGEERWLRRQQICPCIVHGAPVPGAPWPYDVRASATLFKGEPVPNAVREARAVGERVGQPRAHAKTRAGLPDVITTARRRWLRFGEAPSWLLRFTELTASRLVFGHSGLAPEHMMQADPDTYEIALAYVPRTDVEEGEVTGTDAADTWTPAEAASHAKWLLDRLARCLGGTAAEMAGRLAADRLAYEMAECEQI